ncbi:MAG: YciI family protein [Kiloniellales bacterium]|nr:YciI family protein [Kiloniellales bacterium]
MLYSILIYGAETLVESFSEAEEEATLEKHRSLQARLTEAGKLGPFARLMHTTAAVTIRSETGEPVVLDGPFAETKEQLLGLYLIDCESLEDAVEVAKQLPVEVGALEIRPVHFYGPGVLPQTPFEAAPYP